MRPYYGYMRAVTWNVLADAYAKPSWFPFAPDGVLAPGARDRRIGEVLAELGPDVAMLQEVEPRLLETLSARWNVLHAPKGRGKPDGCALLIADGWKVTDHLVHHYDDGTRHVAQVAHLLSPHGQPVTVANAHLRWSPDGDTGLRQVRTLLGLLPDAGTVLLGADLNALPGSPVRDAIADAGLGGAHEQDPTSIFCGPHGNEPRALDVLAARGGMLVRRRVHGLTDAWPSWHHPSDHAAVSLDLMPAP